jgi:phage terminase large subunit-like protein
MAYRKRAKAVIDFIEKLTVPSGVGQGEPFKLRPWQKRFIDKVYGPQTKQGKRIVSQAIFSVARKNGKTALIGALVLAHLCGPEQEINGEIYSAANEREQAAIVFKFVAQMIRLEPELSEILRIVDSTKTIVNYANGMVYRAISAEAGSKHGLNPSVVIYDELGQAKNRDLYDALDTAMGAREEPLFFVISTQNPDPQHILSQLIDDGLGKKDPSIVAEVYTVPEDTEDIFDQKIWKLANPALGDFRLMKDFKKHANRAARMPSFESTFRNLYLNQRIDAKNPLISRAEWSGCQADVKINPGEKVFLALDLSSTTDLCALVAISAEDGDRVAAWFWKPGDIIDEHERRDRVPYRTWINQGFIDAPAGRAVDYGYIAQKLAEINADFDVLGLAYDRWRIEIFLKELSAIGVDYFVDGKEDAKPGALRLVPWGQGFKDISPAIDALETSVINGQLKHNGNPVLTWCMSNAMAITDPAGNRKLDKSKSRFRIDGAVALAMAKGLKARDIEIEPEVIDECFIDMGDDE